ncbi:TRAP transporter small permease [Zobellella aerophila]|uniref:TRAP transporter small permease protein n=1 Tax=Zobellella aerophila TaxID=870480 RepID=A0ABP6WBX0_9GAMM
MSKLLALIATIDAVLVFLIKPVLGLISAAIAFMLALGIFTRAVLDAPLFGLEELILVVAMWIYMLGAVLASRERSHLSADFVQVVCSNPKMIQVMRLLSTLISLLMAVMFVTWSYDLLQWGINKGQATPVFQLPWYISQSSLFVAALLFCFYLIRDLLADLNTLLHPGTLPHPVISEDNC